MISRQVPISPPPQQDAPDLISRLTGLCVYLFFLKISFILSSIPIFITTTLPLYVRP